MTHVPETGAGKWSRFTAQVSGACVMGIRPTLIRSGNRRHKSTTFSGADFWRRFFIPYRLEGKFLSPKISVVASDVNDEFAEVAAIITAGIVAKDKLKRNKS